MTNSPAPASTGGRSRGLVITVSVILGLVLLCTVLNILGANSNAFIPGPTLEPTVDVTAAVQHVATVFTKWYGSTPGAGAATAQPSGVGIRVSPGPFAITVTSVENATQYGERQAQAGNRFVAVAALLESNTEGGLLIQSDEFTLQDADGNQYAATLAKEPVLSSPILLPMAETTSVVVSFEVPQDAGGLVLIFSATSLDPPLSVPIALGF